MKQAYSDKFKKIQQQTLFQTLATPEREDVLAIALENRFTLQELGNFIDCCIDLKLWDEKPLGSRWKQWRKESGLVGREFKKWAFAKQDVLLKDLRSRQPEYKEDPGIERRYRSKKSKIRDNDKQGTLFGMCPVQSEKTLCCNLRTIDAVKNCGFGCSYCSIQTLYTSEDILFDAHFGAKLDAIELDPDRHYHIGTGQSSDALMWGNKNGILDQVFDFARKWPNAVIEFKTKSRNTEHFLGADVPENVICSWSLNPDTVIRNEEHLTAGLSQRLQAARTIASKGTRIAFHLHPMVHYKGWRSDYTVLIDRVLDNFSSDEIVFISFGSLTFPKPIIRQIRTTGVKTRIHQMEMAPNPEGKLTYPDAIKEKMFSHAYQCFLPWHDEVFFYLCMEESRFWQTTFGSKFTSNEVFENSMMKSVLAKLDPSPEHRT